MIDPRGALRQDFKDDHRIGNDRGLGRHRRADDEGVRIADTARHFDLRFAAEWLARFAAQPTRQGSDEVSLNNRVCRCPADHRIGLEPVELVAQFLPFLPGEELSEAHALAQRDIHGIGSAPNVAGTGGGRNLS